MRSSLRSSDCSTPSLASTSTPDTHGSRSVSSGTTFRTPRPAATCPTSLRPRRTPPPQTYKQTLNSPCNSQSAARILGGRRRRPPAEEGRPAVRIYPHLHRARSGAGQFQLQRHSPGDERHAAPLHVLLSIRSERAVRLHRSGRPSARQRPSLGSHACSSTRFTSSKPMVLTDPSHFLKGRFPSESPPARFWLLSFSGPAVLSLNRCSETFEACRSCCRRL